MFELLDKILGQWTLTGKSSLSGFIIAVSVIAATVMVYIAFYWSFRVIGRKRPDSLAYVAWRKFHQPALVTLLVVDFIVLESILTPGKESNAVLAGFLTIAIIFCATWLLIRAINLLREIVLRRYDISDKDNLKARKVYTQFRILERILIFILVLIAIGTALMTFEGIKRIGISLFASAGIAGIILGFAAQKLLGSVLAGFQIALTQPIRIDDVVIVENEWGWIEEITLTYVVVRIWDKRRLIVPTTYFVEKPFQNWTRVSADILGTVFIYTDYRVPVDELRKEFSRILDGTKLWDGKTSVMQVTNATDTALEIRALMSAKDSPTAWDLRVLVREKLVEFLQKNHPSSLPRTRIEIDRDVRSKDQI
jgi:small-conductance mechanosensitive channel